MHNLFMKLLAVPTAYAKDGFITDLDKSNPLGEGSSLVDIINHIFTWLVAFAAVVVPAIIVWGAFQILMSGGNAEKLTGGKKAILWAVIGFVIVLMAKGIVSIVSDALTKAF